MITLVHGSDVHFGTPHLAEVAAIFADAVRRHAPDALVISGDLTQRAKVSEFEAAAAWLKGFGDLPVVVTPGNHDVPLYRIVERVVDPWRNYRRYISADLNTVTRVQGMTIVALNSSAPRRAIVNGRIREDQLVFAQAAFGAAPEGDAKVLVAHHHFAPAPDYEGDKTLPGSRRILDLLERMDVDLILGGHLHRAYIGNSLDVYPGEDRKRGITIVQSGATSSRRGRARERLKNTYNLLRVGRDAMEIVHYLFDPEVGQFRPLSEHRFPRWPARSLPDPLESPQVAR